MHLAQIVDAAEGEIEIGIDLSDAQLTQQAGIGVSLRVTNLVEQASFTIGLELP